MKALFKFFSLVAVTAWHCLQELKHGQALYGGTNIRRNPSKISFKPKNIVKNEGFDIAVIVFDSPADFKGTGARAIALSDTMKLTPKGNLEVFGWGLTEKNEQTAYSDVLRVRVCFLISLNSLEVFNDLS